MGQRVQAVLVEEPPEWEFRSGFFFATCRQTGTVKAIPPNVFFQCFAEMASIARRYNHGGAEVIQFPEIRTG